MDLNLRGKTVLVTGAGKGLGRAIGLAFAAEGADVAFHYNTSAEGAEKAAAEAQELGVNAIAVGADLNDGEAVIKAVAEVKAQLGPIDVLINNSAATEQAVPRHHRGGLGTADRRHRDRHPACHPGRRPADGGDRRQRLDRQPHG